MNRRAFLAAFAATPSVARLFATTRHEKPASPIIQVRGRKVVTIEVDLATVLTLRGGEMVTLFQAPHSGTFMLTSMTITSELQYRVTLVEI